MRFGAGQVLCPVWWWLVDIRDDYDDSDNSWIGIEGSYHLVFSKGDHHTVVSLRVEPIFSVCADCSTTITTKSTCVNVGHPHPPSGKIQSNISLSQLIILQQPKCLLRETAAHHQEHRIFRFCCNITLSTTSLSQSNREKHLWGGFYIFFWYHESYIATRTDGMCGVVAEK